MSKTTIPRGGITADAIDATLIADDAISEEHLDATAITGHTALEATPASTDELLISDAGTLKRIDFSHIGKDNTPHFFGKKASNQTITRNTMTNVTGFTNSEVDSDSAFDGETFTVPSGEGGNYFFSAIVTSDFVDIGNDGERFLVTFEYEGSDSNMPSSDFSKGSGYNIQRYANTVTALINMSAGDTMNVAVYNKDGDASGNAKVTTNSVFMGFKIIT